jgi:hypothetical protein
MNTNPTMPTDLNRNVSATTRSAKAASVLAVTLLASVGLIGGSSTDAEARGPKGNELRCLREGGQPAYAVVVESCKRGKQKVKMQLMEFSGHRNWLSYREDTQTCKYKGRKGKIQPTGKVYANGFSLSGDSDVCVKRKGGAYMFHDGASAPWISSYYSFDPTGYYTTLFRSAGERHDYCYHHGQATYGHDRNYCDKEFKSRMVKICQKKWSRWNPSRYVCQAQANKFYTAVKYLPQAKSAWKAMNTRVRYK